MFSAASRSQPSNLCSGRPSISCACRLHSTTTPEADLRARLARALFEERETNETWIHGATILLPDGTPFDLDAELWQAEQA